MSFIMTLPIQKLYIVLISLIPFSKVPFISASRKTGKKQLPLAKAVLQPTQSFSQHSAIFHGTHHFLQEKLSRKKEKKKKTEQKKWIIAIFATLNCLLSMHMLEQHQEKHKEAAAAQNEVQQKNSYLLYLTFKFLRTTHFNSTIPPYCPAHVCMTCIPETFTSLHLSLPLKWQGQCLSSVLTPAAAHVLSLASWLLPLTSRWSQIDALGPMAGLSGRGLVTEESRICLRKELHYL